MLVGVSWARCSQYKSSMEKKLKTQKCLSECVSEKRRNTSRAQYKPTMGVAHSFSVVPLCWQWNLLLSSPTQNRNGARKHTQTISKSVKGSAESFALLSLFFLLLFVRPFVGVFFGGVWMCSILVLT